MQDVILIPKDRIAVLIGKSGSSRKKIEKLGKIKLWIDSNSNEITINSRDADKIYFARKVVELIGRGFSPDSACRLFDDKYCAEIVDIRDFGGKERKDRKRILGRIIGSEGRTKHIIERETGTEIVVYGKTVSIIGEPEDAERARQAVETILSGSRQATAYRHLKE